MRIAFAGHEMDLRRHELRRAGTIVHVEPQVFDLLLHLLRNRDRVVSKDELFDTIWNGRIVSEAALSSRINAARKAVGDDGDRQELIKTVHKRGFRFVGEARVVEEELAGAMAGEEAAEVVAMAEGLAPPPGSERPPLVAGTSTRKPSIAVLPFANLIQEPDTEYITYGLTEDVIRLLARNRWLDVLSRHSAAAFKGREVAAQEIGAALRVRYLMQGSLQKRGNRMRIAADLICAETGSQLWSETYDFGLADILQVQDTMAQQIAAVIEPELARLEREAAIRKPPGNFDAWDCYQRGLWNLWGFTRPSLAEAEAMFRRSIEQDPGFARAFGALSYVCLQRAFISELKDRPALLENAMRYARTAVALDDRDCMNLCVLGRTYCMLKEPEEAIAALEQCIALNPSFAQGYFALGFAMAWSGREKEALALVDRAIELSPRDPHLTSFFYLQAVAHFSLGDLDASIACSRKAIRLQNAVHSSFVVHAASLGLRGRAAEAGPVVAELLRRMPHYNCAYVPDDFFFCVNDELIARFQEGLRLAGVPEGSAVPSAVPRPDATRASRLKAGA
jgi:TolB-like protein/DNA-binding winged helix-turn-helix (wHTH) protein/Flp pilus assembly protein TadD